MNVTELVQRVRDLLGEQPQTTTQPVMWTDQEIIRAINSAYDSLWTKASLSDENWGVDFTILTGLNAVSAELPGNLLGVFFPEDIGQIIYIEEGVATGESGWEIPPTTVRDMWRQKTSAFPFFDQPSRSWLLAGTQGGMIFTKTDVPMNLANVRVWYKRKAPRLTRLSFTAPSASVLRCNMNTGVLLGPFSTASDYYRNTRWQCTAGSPLNASPQGLTRVVSGSVLQVHPSFDFTTSTPHGAAGTTTWELLPMFPENHHDLIAHLATFRALTKGGDQPQRTVVGQDVATLFDAFVQDIETRQVQYPRTVNYEE